MLWIALVLLPLAWSVDPPYIMLAGTETNKDLCKSGYFQNTAAPYNDGCCSYHQCFDHFRGLQAYKRYCMAPLVWNPEICACDYQANVDGCDPADETKCWGDVEGPPFCDISINPNNDMCCQGATTDKPTSESQDGYKFTLNAVATAERGALYTFCEDRDAQECPGKGDFNLESCCCEDIPCDCECYNWRFNRGPGARSPAPGACPTPLTSFQCNNPKLNETEGVVGQDGTQQDNYLRCAGDEVGAEVVVFQKGYFGKKFTFATFFRCDDTDDCGNGVLFNNGDGSATSTIFAALNDNTGELTVDVAGLELTLSVSDLSQWKYLVITGEFNYGTYEMDIVVTLGSPAPSPVGGPSNTDPNPVIDAGTVKMAGLFGGDCPFQYCQMTGDCDDLAICHFPWTQADIAAWAANANTLPDNPH